MIVVLTELTLGHLHYHLTDVPDVFNSDCPSAMNIEPPEEETMKRQTV